MRPETSIQSLWMLGAGLSFALMVQCIKLAMADHGVLALLLYRSLGGLVLMLVLVRLRKESLRPGNWQLHFWRAFWGIAAIALWYYSLIELAPSTSYALNYLAPLLFVIMSAVMLKEPLPKLILLAACLSFAGALLLLRPDFSTAEYAAALAAAVSGICAALAFLMVRKLGRIGEGGVRVVFYLNVHGILFSLAGMALLGQLSQLASVQIEDLLAVLGVIVFATAGQLALTRGLQAGKTGASAALSYSGVLFTVLIDVGLRNVGLDATDYIGFALIIGSGAWALWLARTKTKIDIVV